MTFKTGKDVFFKIGGLIGLLFCLALPNGLSAAEWFVAKGGSDSNAGTAQAPFLTIQRAVNAASAGDTVNIGAGVFADGEYSAGETKNSHTNRVRRSSKALSTRIPACAVRKPSVAST